VNGRGFPDRLSAEDIPLAAQLVAGASIYDNLVHRGQVPFEEVPGHLQHFRGYQLAPVVVDLLLEIHTEAGGRRLDPAIVAVDIDALRPGMLVARPIRLKTGAVVLPEQTELAAAGIDKLRHHHELGVIGPSIHVYAYSLRS
jgi:putative two-component system response regulator